MRKSKSTTTSASRQRLLLTGLRFFAEKGYESAKIREICEAARSNLAAVNYYFGSKEHFYEEVRDYALEIRMDDQKKFFEDSRLDDPWEALTQYVDRLLSNTYDSNLFYSAWLCIRELLNSSSKLGIRRSKYIQDSKDFYDRVNREMIARLLGDAATEKNVVMLHYTYVSLSLFLMMELNLMKGGGSSLLLQPLITRRELRDHIIGIVRFEAEKMKREHAEASRRNEDK